MGLFTSRSKRADSRVGAHTGGRPSFFATLRIWPELLPDGSGGAISAGTLSFLLYLWLARFDALNGRPVLVFLGIFAALFALYYTAYRSVCSDHRGKLVLVILVYALIFRILLLPAGLRLDLPVFSALGKDLTGASVTYERFLLYDQDVWRYLWEGRVASLGFNPYSDPPSANELDVVAEHPFSPETWREIRDRVAFPEIPALYPPLSLLAFRTSHAMFPGSVLGWKLLLIVLECCAGLFLVLALRALGKPVSPGLLLYAWNPLAIKSFAASAHFDVLVVLALSIVGFAVLTHRRFLAQIGTAMAALSKLVPLLVLPLVGLTPAGAVCLGVAVVLLSSPYFTWRFLETSILFASEWRFNAAVFPLIERAVGGVPTLALYTLLLSGLVVFLWRRGRTGPLDRIRSMLWVLGLAIVLGPVVNPWYVTWLLPFACLVRSRVWLSFSGLVFFAFIVMYDMVERQWWIVLEYLLLLGIAIWDFRTRKETDHEG